jgi:hypothetical protein
MEFRRSLTDPSEPSQFLLAQKEVPDTRRRKRGSPFEKQLKKCPSEL